MSAMTNEQMRVAVAECCGWKRPYPERQNIWTGPSGCKFHGHDGHVIPDYCNDLNACHEMEKVLFADEVLWRKYRDLLDEFRYANDTAEPSAAQRAEAFLKTLGKWSVPQVKGEDE